MLQNVLCVLIEKVISSYSFRNGTPSICNLKSLKNGRPLNNKSQDYYRLQFLLQIATFNDLPLDQWLKNFKAKTLNY